MKKLNLLVSKLKLFAPLKVAYKRFLYNSVIAFFYSFTPAPRNIPRTLKIAWGLSYETLYIETFHTNL